MALPAIHPGQHIAEELKILGMPVATFAERIGVSHNRIAEIVDGRASIAGDEALKLARFFGTDRGFWFNLQEIFDMRTAERKGTSNGLATHDRELRQEPQDRGQ